MKSESGLPFAGMRVAAGLLLIAFGAAGCQKAARVPEAAEAAPLFVLTAPVERQTAVVFEEVPGTIRARHYAGIEANVSGTIRSVSAVPGRSVKAGEVLIELEAAEWQARRDRMEAELGRLESEWRRFSILRRDEVLTPIEFEAAEARYRAGQAALLEAETLLEYTRVVAPFDGVVTRRLVEPGDHAASGRVLLELEDPRSLRLEAYVPESLIGGLKHGEAVAVTVGESVLRGKLVELGPAADPFSRTFPVKVDLPAGSGLHSGGFARLSVPAGERTRLVGPREALIERGQMELVFVVDDGRARLRLVRSGRRAGSEVEFLSGVEEGEVLIVSPPAGLREGAGVRAVR